MMAMGSIRIASAAINRVSSSLNALTEVFVQPDETIHVGRRSVNEALSSIPISVLRSRYSLPREQDIVITTHYTESDKLTLVGSRGVVIAREAP